MNNSYFHEESKSSINQDATTTFNIYYVASLWVSYANSDRESFDPSVYFACLQSRLEPTYSYDEFVEVLDSNNDDLLDDLVEAIIDLDLVEAQTISEHETIVLPLPDDLVELNIMFYS